MLSKDLYFSYSSNIRKQTCTYRTAPKETKNQYLKTSFELNLAACLRQELKCSWKLLISCNAILHFGVDILSWLRAKTIFLFWLLISCFASVLTEKCVLIILQYFACPQRKGAQALRDEQLQREAARSTMGLQEALGQREARREKPQGTTGRGWV